MPVETTPAAGGDISVDALLGELRVILGTQAIELAVARVRISQLEKQSVEVQE